jgi:hypothetical protein
MKTSETVTELGLYSSECCSEALIYDQGDVLQRCPRCHSLCVWELEDQVVFPEDLDGEDGVAA